MNQIYQGWTAEALAVQLDVEKTIDDLPAYQQEGGKLSAAAREKLGGVLDIAYGPEPLQKLDIFAPDGASGAPVLFYIHGGGWRAGSKDGNSFTAEAVNAKGALWVPIDYGLAPDYTIDQLVDHVRSAVKWVYENIGGHGGDPDQIYVCGNSAGGHLTGTCLMPGWHGDYGVPEDIFKGACAMSGVFDLDALVHASYGYNEQLGMDLAAARQFSPIHNLPAKSCPLIISYGEPELEGFKNQSKNYAAAWADAGLQVDEIAVPGAHHFAMARQLADPDCTLHHAMMEMVGI